LALTNVCVELTCLPRLRVRRTQTGQAKARRRQVFAMPKSAG